MADFSPPRGSGLGFLEDAQVLDVDFICVAYNPGRSVRGDSAMVAAMIKRETSKDVVFNLSPRDMNSLALETHLLGASVLGLENVVVVAGDKFSSRDQELVTSVYDYTSTSLIKSVNQMNCGLDFRGRELSRPTDLCVGASVDLKKGFINEARLVQRKIEAGAQFLVTQPVFDHVDIQSFQEAYFGVAGTILSVPVFWGLQLLIQDGIVFSTVPKVLERQLQQGRDGIDIATELWVNLQNEGVGGIYLMPPILRGGKRDYMAAHRFLSSVRH